MNGRKEHAREKVPAEIRKKTMMKKSLIAAALALAFAWTASAELRIATVDLDKDVDCQN